MRETVAHWLELHAKERPDALAFGFVSDRGRSCARLSYAQLVRHVWTVGRRISATTKHQEPVACVLEPGFDFLAAFLGCIWTGRIAVPIAPPRPSEGLDGLLRIAGHSGAKTVITTHDLATRLGPDLVGLGPITVLSAERDDGETGSFELSASASDVALLQYTSGSTGRPKGVVVGHDNLLENAWQIAAAFQHSRDSVGVMWMPPQHDMGLVGGIVHPLVLGFPTYLMSPTELIRSPSTWLNAISEYRATTSGGPNFAFELCVQRIPKERRASFRLESWSVAFCGAEPVSASTLQRFADAFGPSGFNPAAFMPCYGLAEATLQVTAAAKGAGLSTIAAAAASTPGLVGCGVPSPGQTVRIVNPEAGVLAPPGERGEIWIRGPNVARGYWKDPAGTAATFSATLPGDPEPHLRTGDIGYLKGEALYVCGRLKSQIIIRGACHSLEDIEATSGSAHPALSGCITAAYAFALHEEERLHILQETPRALRNASALEELRGLIRSAVITRHGLNPASITFVPLGTVPRTRSGKIQRHLCAARHEEWLGVESRSFARSVGLKASGDQAEDQAIDPI